MNEETLILPTTVVDTLTLTQHAIMANYYECKFQAIGYSLIALIFVAMTIIFGVLYLKTQKRKKTSNQNDEAEHIWLDGLKLMGMLICFALSTAFFMVTIYKTAIFYTAKKSPVGSYQLRYGDNTETNNQKLNIYGID